MGLPFLGQLFTFLSFGRYNALAPTIPDGETSELQTDAAGNLKVSVVSSVTPGAVTTTKASFNTPAASGTIKSAAGTFYLFTGVNQGATTRHIMVFDKSGAVVNGDEPIFQMRVPAGNNFTFAFDRGWPFANGIRWAVSSTAGNATLDGAATFTGNAESL